MPAVPPDPGDLTIHLNFTWWTALGTLLVTWGGLFAGSATWLLRRLKATFATKKELEDLTGSLGRATASHDRLAREFHKVEHEHNAHLTESALFRQEMKTATDSLVELGGETNKALSGLGETLTQVRETVAGLRGEIRGRRDHRDRDESET